MKIKELLKDKNEFIIVLNESNKKLFLEQAKLEGFKWNSGNEIGANDDCFFHILVKNDLTIANLSTMLLVETDDFNQIEKIKYWQN